MVKKMVKYSKFILCIALILSLVAPSYAALSASDGSAFVTKAEFDSALADFNARLTTFEAGINSKIDSQVTSYLDRNGIWNGAVQNLIDFYAGGPAMDVVAQLPKTGHEYYKFRTVGCFHSNVKRDEWIGGGMPFNLDHFMNATLYQNGNSNKPWNVVITPICKPSKSGLCVWKQFFICNGSNRAWDEPLPGDGVVYTPAVFFVQPIVAMSDIVPDDKNKGYSTDLLNNFEVVYSLPFSIVSLPDDSSSALYSGGLWGWLFGDTFYFFVRKDVNIYVVWNTRAGYSRPGCYYFGFVAPGQLTNGGQKGFEPSMFIY